ncbi:DUF899 domain-containing protein [bacterium]|nr:MAG: DUF899 domain-containing protein [bacterium]
MTPRPTAAPKVVSREEWIAARQEHLAQEKELTRRSDALHAERRRLPMVKIEKEYSFDTFSGKKSLAELFDGKKQLVVYHFMFDPKWDKGCPGCTGLVDALGDLSLLGERNTAFSLISRAPLEKLEGYKKERGWEQPWVSSFGSDFNYDFFATLDREESPQQFEAWEAAKYYKPHPEHSTFQGEQHGFSVFFREGEELFHTYSTFARGAENMTNSYALLDMTPYGRQEDWEDSPAGWPQEPTYG